MIFHLNAEELCLLILIIVLDIFNLAIYCLVMVWSAAVIETL